MAVTLIVNTGSSSKKFALYDKDKRLVSSYVESDGRGYNMCTLVEGMQQHCDMIEANKYDLSLNNFIKQAEERKLIEEGLEDIKTVALRVVAPGTFFQKHQEINDDYLHKLRTIEPNAPLHIPHLLREIKIIRDLLPKARLIAVSDSAFHATLPEVARNYSLPENDVKNYDLYRFGYHGISISSVFRRVHAVSGVDPKRAIVCHVGSGVSVTAVKDGKSIDTTMGYAPGTGLIMSSRAGDLDVGVMLSFMQMKNLKPVDAETYLQTQGGLKGISGEIDLRLLLERKAQKNIIAEKAVSAFVYQLKKAIGSYFAILGGLDMIIFTATAAERSPVLRSYIIDGLGDLGIKIDQDKNQLCVSKDGVISEGGSKVKVVVIKTDESDEIYRISKGV
ncbi:MAG: hypothetical protein R3B60_02130 [Candidatus Paceibacterota bacterium]